MAFDRPSRTQREAGSDRIFWNVEEVLGVRPGCCTAITRRGTLCRQWMFSNVDMQQTQHIIGRLSRCDPRQGISGTSLEELAFLTGCPRWHRRPGYTQFKEIVARWQSIISTYAVDSRSDRQRRIDHGQNSSNGMVLRRTGGETAISGVRSTTATITRTITTTTATTATASTRTTTTTETISMTVATPAASARPTVGVLDSMRGEASSSSAAGQQSSTSLVPTAQVGRVLGELAADMATELDGTLVQELDVEPRSSTSIAIQSSITDRLGVTRQGTSPVRTASRLSTASNMAPRFATLPTPRVGLAVESSPIHSATTSHEDTTPGDNRSILHQTSSASPSTSTAQPSPGSIGEAPSTMQLLTPPASPRPVRTVTRPYVPRRRSLGDCSICMDSLLGSTDDAAIVYCRAQCGQNFHRYCMEDWKEQQIRNLDESNDDLTILERVNLEHRRRNAVLCPYCRSLWQWQGDQL